MKMSGTCAMHHINSPATVLVKLACGGGEGKKMRETFFLDYLFALISGAL